MLRRTEELHLSGLIWSANHPYMQKTGINGFLFEKKATLAV